MLGREFMDATIPDTDEMWALASRITGIDLSCGYRAAVAWRVHEGLEWLAQATEEDCYARFKFDWQEQDHPLYSPSTITWARRAWGLEYKPRDNYLTNEGWGIGTTCWFVRIECGSRWCICAETQHLAVLRGIIVMHALALDRATAPKLRKSMYEVIKQVTTESITT